jgi:hypothetical protein
MTTTVRQVPWSLLQTEWLDVPIGADCVNLTWGTFSEGLESCLRDVSLHVSRRLKGHERLESVVTDVVVENLHLFVSQLGQREKLDRLLIAADRLIARGAAATARRTGSILEARDVTGTNRMSDA